MASVKLNYARHRNAQKKPESGSQSSQQVPIKEYTTPRLENESHPSHPTLKNASASQKEFKAEKIAGLFGKNTDNGNLDYINSLIKSRNNAQAKSNKKPGHAKTKSTLIGSGHKFQPQQAYQPNQLLSQYQSQDILQQKSLTPNADSKASPFQNKSLNTGKENDSTAADFCEGNTNESQEQHLRQQKGRQVPTTHFSVSNNNAKPLAADGSPETTPNKRGNSGAGGEKLFDQFFKGGMRRSMSFEDIRLEKKDFASDQYRFNQNQSTNIAPEESILSGNASMNAGPKESAKASSKTKTYDPIVDFAFSVEKIEKGALIGSGFANQSQLGSANNREANNQTPQPHNQSQYNTNNESTRDSGDFITSLDSYIKYFDNDSEDAAARQAKLKQYYAQNSGKTSRAQQKEIEGLQNENRGLKLHVEKLKSTINDLVMSNKNLDGELISSRLKYDEYKHSIQNLEDQVLQLKHKNKYYKAKLSQVQDLLAQEKIENENNLLALKKVLANNINYALDHNKSVYTNGSAVSNKDKHLQNSNGSHHHYHHQKESKEAQQILKNALSDSYLPPPHHERPNKHSKRKERYGSEAVNLPNGTEKYQGSKKSSKHHQNKKKSQPQYPNHGPLHPNELLSSDEYDHEEEEEVTSNHSYDSPDVVGSFDDGDYNDEYENYGRNGGHQSHHHHHHSQQQQQQYQQRHHNHHGSGSNHHRDLSQNQSPNHYYQSSNQRRQDGGTPTPTGYYHGVNGENPHSQGGHGQSQHNKSVHKIKHLQEKLADMLDDEQSAGYSAQNPYFNEKKSSQRNKSKSRLKNVTDLQQTQQYEQRKRQASLSHIINNAVLKFDPRDPRDKYSRGGMNDYTSPDRHTNDQNNSFSLQNSD